jgi:cytochrome c-type biogenesis protein CcmH/NrfG
VTAVLLLVSGVMAAVAAAGILRPFGRGRGPAIEPLADPLEDERDLLLSSLRELEDEHTTGALGDDEYRSLRRDTERRAVAVLRAIDAREGGEDGLSAFREAVSPNGHHPAPRAARGRARVVVVSVAVAVSVAVLLAGSVRNRDAAQPITGDSASDTLAFFQQRVQQHPHDVAARLDLAERYRDAGMAGLATLQFSEALQLDPSNAEALTGMAFSLFAQGRTRQALAEVNQALVVDPTYPEALYQEGVILLRGLHRPAAAEAPLRAYLTAAPDGAHRAAVEGMLAEIAATPNAAKTTPSPGT